MLRFVLKVRTLDGHTGLRQEWFETLDCDVPVLEEKLRGGGRSESAYFICDLEGVEIKPE